MPRGVFDAPTSSSSGSEALSQLRGRTLRTAATRALGAIAIAASCYGVNSALRHLDMPDFPTQPPMDDAPRDDYSDDFRPELSEFQDQLASLDVLGFNVTPEQVALLPEARFSATQAQEKIVGLLTLDSNPDAVEIDPNPAFPDIIKPQPAPHGKAGILDCLNKNILYDALLRGKAPVFHNPSRKPAATQAEWLTGGSAWEYVLPEIVEETDNGYIIGFNTVPLNVRKDGELISDLNAVTHPYFLARLEFNSEVGELGVTVIQDRAFDPSGQLTWQRDLLQRRQGELDCSRVACVPKALPFQPDEERPSRERFDPDAKDAEFDKWWHPESPLIKGDVLSTPKAEYTADQAARDIKMLLMLGNDPEFQNKGGAMQPPQRAEDIIDVIRANNKAFADEWPLFHHPGRKDNRGDWKYNDPDGYLSPHVYADLSSDGAVTGYIMCLSYRTISSGADHSDVRNPTFMFRVELKNGEVDVSAIQKRFSPDDEVSWEYYRLLRLPQNQLYTGHIVNTTYVDIVDQLDPSERSKLENEWGKRKSDNQSMRIDPKDEIARFKKQAARRAQIKSDKNGWRGISHRGNNRSYR